ncbi:hypothetical protein [Amycolatopsis sp. PS_44_ISF1]|uniref:hypothetical protein n=1 Tax=Amycolatopsis sp. PS_44_ISF1 TaxID=2974917 RepID=UPI0028DDEDB5|nr:hypothetical protein [Amycolatopsis sp. PS_44_ISF1]MDT8911385.1 hypothetical protein [Amycolatopsis sp. PS_44_ISF1]
MTILTTVGACLGLLVLVLMSLAPALVELDARFPVAQREQGPAAKAPRTPRAARPTPGVTRATRGTRITAHA